MNWGCGNGVILEHGSALTGCSTACINDTVSDKNNCLGFSCCHTAIPHYLKSYSVNLRGLERHGGDGGCGSAFLVDQVSYVKGSFSPQSVPLSLVWILSDHDLPQINCCTLWSSFQVDMRNDTSVVSLKCHTEWEIEGNPYLPSGCKAKKNSTPMKAVLASKTESRIQLYFCFFCNHSFWYSNKPVMCWNCWGPSSETMGYNMYVSQGNLFIFQKRIAYYKMGTSKFSVFKEIFPYHGGCLAV
ncbi:Concanavalin A-like lectin/glucanase, subgroup [Artemisia annua]|uniref:Concanavalin A-like lectin/glucanase, subgroup n=1 Tax=Artemisia annua TaxID=35608 RepID=A0A2U1MPE7_ARTAN|nr:Concanavalin A-like lectin/glucanase, subgroup [Artemisia annua]